MKYFIVYQDEFEGCIVDICNNAQEVVDFFSNNEHLRVVTPKAFCGEEGTACVIKGKGIGVKTVITVEDDENVESNIQ